MKKLAEYELIGEIGRGSMGTVYKAWHPERQAYFALKVPHQLSPKDMPGYIRRFKNEAKLAMLIKHPNIVDLYEVRSLDKISFMVMEYVEGVLLEKRLKSDGPVPAPQALKIAQQVALALEAIHGHDVIHHDIKPSNVMINVEGRVKLLDFGVAKVRDRKRGSTEEYLKGEIVGTPYYISPEQTEGKRADHRADLYALGVVLFRMLTGEYPFKGTRRWELFENIRSQPTPSLRAMNRDIEPDVEEIVMKALAKNPDLRHQSAREMADEFGELADDISIFL